MYSSVNLNKKVLVQDIHLTTIMWFDKSDFVFPQLFKTFPHLTPYDMTSCKGTLSQKRTPGTVNTIPVYQVSTFAFASQPSPFVPTYRRKGWESALDKKKKKDETVAQIVACGQGGRGCACLCWASTVWGFSETRYLPHETAAEAHDGLTRTLVSLRFHSLLFVCLIV